MKSLSCFITGHGFGHATRTIAILEALRQLEPDLEIQLITTVPAQLFEESETIIGCFDYLNKQVDVGLVQTTALNADIPATITKLDEFLPFNKKIVSHLAESCQSSSAILCDIAPLGITVGKAVGIPSVLVENFTWDWIYKPFEKEFPTIQAHTNSLKKIFDIADYRIQTEPLCSPAPHDLLCPPIFRQKRNDSSFVRSELRIGDEPIVLVTMGGIAQHLPHLKTLDNVGKNLGLKFVFTGQKESRSLGNNILLLSRKSSLYHPDLIHASDIVVCKTGYSTVAECYQAGVRVIAVGRTEFAESEVIMGFLKSHLSAVEMDARNYLSGNWTTALTKSLEHPQPKPATQNGADSAAAFIQSILSKD